MFWKTVLKQNHGFLAVVSCFTAFYCDNLENLYKKNNKHENPQIITVHLSYYSQSVVSEFITDQCIFFLYFNF